MNIANKLTLLRVFLIPLFIISLLGNILPYPNNEYVALAIFIIASLTDFLDGYLARRLNLITTFGKFMDPLADKLLVTTALICFVQMDRLSSIVVIIIVAREFIISGFRLVAASNNVVIAASWWGKIKTVTQMLMIILLFFNLQSSVWGTIQYIVIILAVIFTIVSLIDYLYKNIHVLKDQM